MKLRMLAILVFVASMFASANLSAAGSQQTGPLASAKIATWVLEHTANGKEAEFLVVLTDQADLSDAEDLQTKEEKGWYVYNTLYEKAQASQRPVLDWLEANGIEHRSYYIVNMIWVKGRIDVAAALAARSDVARVDGNPMIHNEFPQPSLQGEKATALSPEAIEAGINYTNAPQVWALGYTGQGIVVGGGDTGYQWDHPALKPHYRGWNGATANHDYNWHDSIHSSVGNPCGNNSTQPCDDGSPSHGTHTIGTTTGDDSAGNQIGMAPGAKWIGCRNMDEGNGTPATYTECFQFFLAPYPVGGTPAQGDPAKAPDVTTNSWGCPASEGCSVLTLQSIIAAQRAAGIVTVVAAGNSGGSGCATVSDPPSFYAESFTVGALNTGTDTIASFSSRGPVTADGSNRQKPDISAPGTGTRSSLRGNTYGSLSGTSMATPHVAGAVALLLSADPSRRGQVSTIEGILKDSAVHLPSSLCSSSGVPNNVFGYGRLDVKGAVDLALTTITPASAVGERRNARGSVVVNAPTSTTQWTVVSNANWIVLTSPGSSTGSGLVTYELRENSTGHFRIGTLTIARRTFTIIQSGVAPGVCSNSIAPVASLFGVNGGLGAETITAGPECIWNATSNANWIVLASPTSGIGNGSVSYSVALNGTGATRKGTITIAGRIFNVKQKGSSGGD